MTSLRFNEYFHSVADAGMELLRNYLPSSKMHTMPLPELCARLLSNQGEASGMAIARNIVHQLNELDESGRLKFFETIYRDFNVDHESVLEAANNYCQSQDQYALQQLIEQSEPKRQELFRRINMAPGGTRVIVELRRDLLRLQKKYPHFSVIDFDMKHLLFSWFNRGFLTLEQINWETPALVLEKLIEYETVHEMKGWDDLRSRLSDDRRCFAFFHPALPSEPLIFVEVALAKGLAKSIDPIIETKRLISNPREADTAIFYSINNCQRGLKGISFGNLLIKQVVERLSQELPNIQKFSTLSPIPGFFAWVSAALEQPEKYDISEQELELLTATLTPRGFKKQEPPKSLKSTLMRLAAIYFAFAKRVKKPADPVARFHLRNGASLVRINWLGDRSANGLQQSAGMLVNYLYDPNDIVKNHENYVRDNKLAIAKNVVELIPRKLRLIHAKEQS